MIDMKQLPAAAHGAIPLPESGRVVVFLDDAGNLCGKMANGAVRVFAAEPRTVLNISAPAVNTSVKYGHGMTNPAIAWAYLDSTNGANNTGYKVPPNAGAAPMAGYGYLVRINGPYVEIATAASTAGAQAAGKLVRVALIEAPAL